MKSLFSLTIALLLLIACNAPEKSPNNPFIHGVASGDPLPDRVIIWTRVTPDDSVTSNVSGNWEIASDKEFRNIIQSKSFETSSARDFTVKVDVGELQPDTYYYYRFQAFNKTSPIGRTKTAPVVQKDSLKFAIVSCSNWEWGYFNAYAIIAQKEVDAVLHLGDYIYEYGTGVYGDTTIGRKNLPPHEIVSLQDYRIRHAQYRTDEGLKMLSQQHPFITIWDDHEVANNVYLYGAQNHQPEKEGDFEKRKAAARQAYYEWVPIRESEKHYRSFSYGPLADLIMLDERLEGREAPPSTFDSALQKRSMLGNEQLQWLENKLKNSTALWKVIGNQVMFTNIDLSGSPYGDHNFDSWEGYAWERNQIEDFIMQQHINNIIITTGDTHASWAFDVPIRSKTTYNAKTSKGAIAVELGAPSVSSANLNESKPDSTVIKLENYFLKQNPHMKFANERDHGYLLLTLYTNKAKANWYFVETLRKPSTKEKLAKTLTVNKDTHRLQ